MIEPQIGEYFETSKRFPFEISHCAGIETGGVLVIQSDLGRSDDLIWAGKAPSLAVELSRLHGDYLTYVTGEVYERLNRDAKDADDPAQEIWEEHSWEYLGRPLTIYGSDWTWEP